MAWESTRKIIDDMKDADFFYGGERFELTSEEFEALKQGKILNFGVCTDEYGITIRLSPEALKSFKETPDE